MGWYQKQKRIYESRQQNHEHDLPEDEVVHSEAKKEDMTKMEENKDAQQPVKPQESASLIGEHTEVTGDVSTDDDLTIYGRVKGISSAASVFRYMGVWKAISSVRMPLLYRLKYMVILNAKKH